ncbi:PKD domain-containing protein [Solirubrobacter deserti]|uniref:PKD domain-containing protein n=1 Tax=Solirubrobacter deserti TaxID=2282478 RepID=A0ABT4RUB4_9ACTN|nr:PKD domain-containing protein [Solirubrobacter deserti]MDA0141973.1 PKD domain-containing protein [Solirubrobacter deserti]
MRLLVSFVLLLGAACLPGTARASISSLTPIDGPSAEIVDFGGVAMAPDGTGGVVYRKRVDGRIHIFAAQFDSRGGWRAPQRVDNGQRFDSSWPAIGAGNGGRLVVAWVQEYGPSTDRLYSAALDPGARRFQPPVPIDLNVGESTGTWPSIAMAPSGNAFISYLAMQVPGAADPPGYARGELRGARYDGALWSGFGFPLNRNTAAPLRLPAAGATPRLTIDVQGNGLLAWQEPDDQFVDRVWARRIFGSGQVGIATLVSPATWEEQPLRAGVDQFSLDTAGFGQGAIAYRQLAAPGGPLPGPRIMLATIPEVSSPDAARFGAPRIVDGAGAAAPAAVGPPSVAVDRVGDTATVFGLGQRSVLVGADDRTVNPPERLDDGRTSIPGTPVVDLAASGASVAAWQVRRGGAGGIGVSERRSDGVPTAQALTAPVGGIVSGFALAGSGLGDAIVGWAQGPESGPQIAAVVVDAPPDPFAVQTPVDWVRTVPELQWEVPAHAIGGVKYAVTVDDDTVAENLTRTKLALRSRNLDDGVQVVQVIAEDAGGQETTSRPAELKLDRRKPRVRVQRFRNRLVQVRVRDGARSSTSGADTGPASMRWGDGKRSSARRTASHRYAGGGPFTVTVRATDKAGNRVTTSKRVSP